MLDILGLCVLAVSAEGRVLYANKAADRVMNRNDGLGVRSGTIICLNPATSRQLSRAIALVAAGDDMQIDAQLVKREPGMAPYQLSIVGFVHAGETPAAAILFRDPDSEDVSLASRLRALFDLTSAEANLAIALTKGASLPEIASSRAVRKSTVRSQVKSVAAKMRCNRQAEIVAIVAKLPALHLA